MNSDLDKVELWLRRRKDELTDYIFELDAWGDNEFQAKLEVFNELISEIVQAAVTQNADLLLDKE